MGTESGMFGAAVGAFDLWLIEAAVGLPIASKPAVHGPTPPQYRRRESPERGGPGLFLGTCTAIARAGDIGQKDNTHPGERTTDRALYKGRIEQSQVQRRSAEEAGRNSWCSFHTLSRRFIHTGLSPPELYKLRKG